MKPKLLIAVVLLVAVSISIGVWRQRTRSSGNPAGENIPGKPAGRGIAADASPRTPATLAAAAALASPAVQSVVDGHRDYDDRVAAIAMLSTNMPASDWKTLQEFLLVKDAADAEPLGQVLKNRLMDMLCALNPPPAGVEELLVRVYRDRNQDPVIRDYAVQHLAAYFEQMEVAQIDDPRAQRMIQDVLWEALNETDGSIGGTALLALERLSRERAEFDRSRVAASALRMAGEGSAGELTRITAFQICGQMEVNEAGPLLLAAAQNADTMPLRISAIGALGSLGDSQTLPFLTGIVNGAEQRLIAPAEHALEEIQRREEEKARKPKI